MTRKAKMRDVEPGPVNVLIIKLRMLTLDAIAVAAMLMVNAMDFTGNRVADAMMRTGEVNKGSNPDAATKETLGRAAIPMSVEDVRFDTRISGRQT